MTLLPDEPKSLANPEERAARAARVHVPHVSPLNELVQQIRREESLDREVPYFDPDDGGVNALCLFVLEAPGPKAVSSGFVSRNNPDETAKNFFLLSRQAKLPRTLTVSWNIVPWYIGTGSKIRPASNTDVQRGLPYFERLVYLLPRLQVVVLVGRKAQRAESRVRQLLPNAHVLPMLHPSPLVLNTNAQNKEKIRETLRKIAGLVMKPGAVTGTAPQ